MTAKQARDAIRAQLLFKGVTLAQIATDLGMAYSTVYGVVSGMRSHRVEARIAQVLGKPVEEVWPDRYPQRQAN